MAEKRIIIATARFADYETYAAFWRNKDLAWHQETGSQLLSRLREQSGEAAKLLDNWIYKRSCFFSGHDDPNDSWCSSQVNRNLEDLKKDISYAEKYDQPLSVYAVYEGIGAWVALGSKELFLVEHEGYLRDYTPAKDYSGMSVGEIRALASGTNVSTPVPATVPDGLSANLIHQNADAARQQLTDLESQLKDAREGRSAELAALKEEAERAMKALEEKKQALMDTLNAKKKELQQQVEVMNDQIFLLESQIYAIRCYAGEVVNFAQLRKGRNAADTEPIVLHQKLRYLDEEMGRLTSIYEMDTSELNYFEDFLSASPVALDVFAPNERCVTLVRLSRTGRRFKMSEKYANMLEEYRLYHGNTVGIVIRNGENVYIGWTDAAQVHVTDDFIMEVDPKAFHVNNDFIGQETEAQREQRLVKERADARQVAAELVSRIFIFNILQGIVDNSDLLPLPEGITISRESVYVKFSMADKWLSDNRFGSFADIVQRCNEPELHKGDTVLTVQFLRPKNENHNIYRQWSNDRGRGEKNRTWDCSVSDCQVYSINLVEYDEPRQRTYYQFRMPGTFGEADRWINGVTNGDGSTLDEKQTKILETKWERDPHFFVSVKKMESNSGTARSNFEIYPDEVINLTYMNSVWLEYAINNRNLGGWVVGHQAVDYAYGIRYLNTALEHVRHREAEETALLNEADPTFLSTHPDWPVQLSEWKLTTGTRRLTPRSAKQFLRSLAH